MEFLAVDWKFMAKYSFFFFRTYLKKDKYYGPGTKLKTFLSEHSHRNEAPFSLFAYVCIFMDPLLPTKCERNNIMAPSKLISTTF